MLRANTTFFHGHRRIGAGDIVSDDDPVVAGREDYFDRLEVTSRPVEEATAVPGRKRRTAPKPKAAKD